MAPLWIGDRARGEALIARVSHWDGAQVAQQGALLQNLVVRVRIG